MEKKNVIPTISLSMKTLIRECSLRKCSDEELANIYSRLVYKHHIHEVFGYHRLGYNYCNHITLYNNGDYVMGYFKPSYEDFLQDLLHTLGMNTQNPVDNQNLTFEMLSQIKKLGDLKNYKGKDSRENHLRAEFPVLYRDLTHGRGYLMETPKKERKPYYSCGLRVNFEHFLKAQCEMYYRFIMKRNDYKNSVEQASYNLFIKDQFDLNKVAMYAVHEYLNVCENTNDSEVIKKYLSLIEKYEQSNFSKSVSLMSDDGQRIDWPMLQKRIQAIKNRDSRYFILDSELLPGGSKVRSCEVGKTRGASRSIQMTPEEINHLKEAGERKNRFYENSPYVLAIEGSKKDNGYRVFIYANGEALADTRFNHVTMSGAVGDATYHFKAKDFEELSGHTKTFLQNDERVERFIHSSNWEEKVRQVVEKEATEESKEEVKQLILKLKEHK